jgi:hypothetical protein
VATYPGTHLGQPKDVPSPCDRALYRAGYNGGMTSQPNTERVFEVELTLRVEAPDEATAVARAVRSVRQKTKEPHAMWNTVTRVSALDGCVTEVAHEVDR